MRFRPSLLVVAPLVVVDLAGGTASAQDNAPQVVHETPQQFLDSQADRVLAPDANQIYRQAGKRREIDLGQGVVASYDEEAPSRIGSGVATPSTAGAPGQRLGLDVNRDPWLGELWYQKAGSNWDAGLSTAYQWSTEWSLRGEARERRNSDLMTTRQDEQAALRFAPGQSTTVDLGVHRARLATDVPQQSDAADFWHARGEWRPPAAPGLALEATAERRTSTQPPDDAMHADRFEVGASYAFGPDAWLPHARVYWREATRLGLLSDGDALDVRAAYRRTIGIEAPDGTPGGTVYTQVQQRGLADASDSLLIVGWRHPFRLRTDTTLDTHIEQATPIAGPSAVRSFAAGARLGISRFPRDALVSDLEVVDSDLRDSIFNDVQYTARTGENTVGLIRTAVTWAHPHDDDSISTTDYKATFALGWREPEHKLVSLLGGYSFIGRNSHEPGVSDRKAHVVLGYAGTTLDRDDAAAARWSRRWDRDDVRPDASLRITTFSLARLVHDFDAHWSLSAHAAARSDTLDGIQTGYGAELGYRLSGKAVLAVGYNPRGFVDSELTLDERPQKGWVIRLRFFIDSALGRWLDPPIAVVEAGSTDGQ